MKRGPLDFETFSKPDRTVSFARIDANGQLAELKDFLNYLFMEFLILRTDIMDYANFNPVSKS